MSLRDYQVQAVREFGGAMPDLDPVDVRPGHALMARNVRFLKGSTATRLGFKSAIALNRPHSAAVNWVGGLGNFYVYYETDGLSVRAYNISTAADAQLIAGSLVGFAASFANAGSRLYCTPYNTAGRGVTGARVASYQSGSFVGDLCFPAPMTTVPTMSEPSTGEITAGVRMVGYRVEYRHGVTGRASPDSSSGSTIPDSTTFAPVSFTATGGQNARFSLTATWPTGAVRVHVMMTTKDNLARFIMVPGASAAVTGGASSTINIDFDITDQALLGEAGAQGDATFSLYQIAHTVGGTAPIQPYHGFTAGNRLIMLATLPDANGNPVCTMFASNPDAYQEITYDEHIKPLPGNRDITTGFYLRGQIYLLGPDSTHYTSDTGDLPVFWPPPQFVGQIGTLSIRGFCVASNGEYAWVADQSGLYAFNGKYANQPTSYYQTSDWERINWNAAQYVQVLDNATTKMVYVLAPLDSATMPTYILAWDYSEGLEADKVDYTLLDLTEYPLGTAAIVANTLSTASAAVFKRQELWLGPGRVNLAITDPGFERNNPADDLWDEGTLWLIAADANARTGSYCALRVADGATGASELISKRKLPANQGKAYYVSGFAKGAAANGSVLIGLRFYDATDATLLTVTASLAGPLASYTNMGTSSVGPSGTAYVRVFFSTTGHTSGTYYVDDMTCGVGNVLREAALTDTDPFEDNGINIETEYQTALLPTGKVAQAVQHHGAHVRLTGAGTARLVMQAMDNRKWRDLLAIDNLAELPGTEILRKADMRSEQASYRISSNLCRDAGFEAFSGEWVDTGGFAVAGGSSTAHSGTNYLYHAGAAADESIAAATPLVTIELFYQYYFSVWVKSDSDGVLLVGLRFYDANMALVEDQVIPTPLSTTWTKVYGTFYSPAGSAFVAPVFTVHAKTTGTYYVDDIYWAYTPSWLTFSTLKHYFTPYTGSM